MNDKISADKRTHDGMTPQEYKTGFLEEHDLKDDFAKYIYSNVSQEL